MKTILLKLQNRNITWEQYKHAIPLLLYMIIYMLWWSLLEDKVTSGYRVIHMSIDDHIPFCEIFIVPYLMWFAYVSITVIILFFKDETKKDYYRCLAFLFTGMTLFLIISTIMPNGHQLRPTVMPRDNIFTRMISALWRTDTPTNLWPSIHVYNSLGAYFAIKKSQVFKNHALIRISSLLLTVSIILSTVLIKQHSMFDVLTAFALSTVMYVIVYGRPNASEKTTEHRQNAVLSMK